MLIQNSMSHLQLGALFQIVSRCTFLNKIRICCTVGAYSAGTRFIPLYCNSGTLTTVETSQCYPLDSVRKCRNVQG